jgi:hypothetical protein
MSGVDRARAFERPPVDPEDLANSATLRDADWLVCNPEISPDKRFLEGWTWDRESRKFVRLGHEYEEALLSPLILIFDHANHLAGTIGTDGSVNSSGPVFRPMDVAPGEPVPISITLTSPRETSTAYVTISYLTSTDGRFAGVMHLVAPRAPLFPKFTILDLFVSCATTADDELKRTIEQARAKWLSEPAASRSGMFIEH